MGIMPLHSSLIAQISLSIGAIKLRPDDPFTWASGYRMPIYNDNRMLLRDYNHRMLVANALVELIEKEMGEGKESYPCYIAGTSTAGIAPAVSVAKSFGVPLLILQDGLPYVFEQPFTVHSRHKTDIVASTCPWSIPYGVTLANDKELPFVYVRQAKKTHGLQQQIEGITKPMQTAMLINYYYGKEDDYAPAAVDALAEQKVLVTEIIKEDISKTLQPADIKGKRVIMIEDLISTGGSSAEEVNAVRRLGASCNLCVSIFHYEFVFAVLAFDYLEPRCDVRPALTYRRLLQVANERKYLTEEQMQLLKEWREDPFGWGEKHGFPKIERAK